MKATEPKITVLMPVYNAEAYLEEAINSILSQTFRDFEFLIIDDCSKDNSVKIIESYQDSRIRLVKNEGNLGVAATLNKGVELASCELIARMDADDYSYPERLEKQFNYFRQHPDCVLLYTFSRKISADRSKVAEKKFTSHHLYYNLLFHCPIRHPSVMYKRSVVKEVGMYDKTFVEDFNLWFRISRKYKLHHLDEILFEYRVTDSSTSRVFKKKESEAAYYNQVVSNIQFYTGTGFHIAEKEIYFLRGLGLEQIKNDINNQFVIRCFKKLDYITACVLAHKSPYEIDPADITGAAFEKKRKLISQLGKQYDFKKILSILCRLGYWSLVAPNIKNYFGQKLWPAIRKQNAALS
jgi:glycosyltransferase involved in cell wall biosynthesis